MRYQKYKILFSVFIFFATTSYLFLNSCPTEAATVGEEKNFYIDSSYDYMGREEISARLQRASDRLYFYVDNSLWSKLSAEERNKLDDGLLNLVAEFESKIYPVLTSAFGSEWKPGIDNDEHITVLIHPMKKDRAGYVRLGDEYPKFSITTSNEREMAYLNSDYVTSSIEKSFLAHEFMHLITFNQKDRIQGVQEDIWLNEAMAEYAPTFLGYDAKYEGSNLQMRVNEFLRNPSDSIVDWQNTSADYGVLNVFTQYLVDHYGVKILTDSLYSSKKGIESINYALLRNGFKEDFSQIFIDWTIAVLVNDCSVGGKYCYKNPLLKNVRVAPLSNFLPINSQSLLSVNYSAKPFAGSWYKIFGGGGILTFEFEGSPGGQFKVPFLLCNSTDICTVKFLSLDQNQIGKVIIEDFNKTYISLTAIPSVHNTNNPGSNFLFKWEARIDLNSNSEDELTKQLLAQIASLEAEIARLHAAIYARQGGSTILCSQIIGNLYFGLTNNQEVRCLQEFLKNQGPDIYPEGLVTGNFLSLTKAAIIRFQEKYATEILVPLGLTNGTGYVGSMTRTKINQILGY